MSCDLSKDAYYNSELKNLWKINSDACLLFLAGRNTTIFEQTKKDFTKN